ncbi:MAG TPA: Gfo/Idh/MocA family oxidoreductase [Candidatus Hydrogenedentes bacterium]|nr:Gfo/Idh/MocA family oxidoreductase [Candidatus Hydrogenedentota bacterium]HPG68178.1 Gfo/Idh/MocA family oxidoreductase [Candidatus Hydrogenedentota bacterium]
MAPEGPFRAGVIGVGAIAQACHLPGYDKDMRAQLVAFADPEPKRHKEMAKLFPMMKGYAHFKDMLANEHLDTVSICTPNKYHQEAALAAFEAKCHVLCEKPISVTLKEADEIIAAAKNARRKLMIGFTHRLFEGPTQCKQLLKEKAIGTPFMIRVRFAHGGPYPGWAKSDWFYEPTLASGGALLDMGIHAIDLCLWLMGPAVSVMARCATLVRKIPVDDNSVLILEFKNKALGYIEVGWTSKPGFTGIEIYGTKGTLICDYRKGLYLCGGKASAGRDSVVEWKTLNRNPTGGGWSLEIGHWLDILEGKEKLSMTGQSGRDALEVALAAYKSSSTGRAVGLEP